MQGFAVFVSPSIGFNVNFRLTFIFVLITGQLLPRPVLPPSDCEDEEEDEDDEEHLAHLKMEEEMEDEEEECMEGDNSLSQLQHYNSDSSEEFAGHGKSSNTSPILTSATSSFVISTVSSPLRPDSGHKKSNQDTMSYLKSKRIVRHRSNDSEINKKQKLDLAKNH